MSREKKILYSSIMVVLLLLFAAAQNKADASTITPTEGKALIHKVQGY